MILALLLIFLPSQLGLHFWPVWANINGLRVDYFSPTLYFTDILVLLLFLLEIFNQFTIKKFSKYFLVYFLVGSLIYLNIVHSLSPAVSTYKWVKIAEFAFLAYYVSKRRLNYKLLLIPVFYSAILTIWQFLAQSSIGGLWYFLGERTFTSLTPGIANAYINGQLLLRPYATFPHPNVLGGFLAVVLPLILLYFPHNNRRFTAAILALGYIALFLSLSRSAILVGLLATALIFKRSLITLIALSFLIVLLLPRFSSLQFETEPLAVRFDQVRVAVTEFSRSPVIGTGLGSSPFYLSSSANYSLVHQPIHNIYLLLLSETGLVGLGSFVILIFLALRNYLGIKNWKLKIPLLCILLLGLFDHYFLTLQQGQLIFALILGTSLSKKS